MTRFNSSLARRSVLALAALAATALIQLPAQAQTQPWPSKPIRIIVPFGTGTTSDVLARLLSVHMGKALNQSMVVDNVAGAGGLSGTTQLARAPKDGYTIALVNNAHVINPSIYKDAPFDAIKDIAPIGVVGQTPLVLLVNPNVPARDVKELIALAKAKPGALSYGSSGNGGVLHLAAVLFTSEAGVDIKHVPYKLSGQMLTDLIGGTLDIAFPAALTAATQVNAGKVRALAVTSTQRSAILPNVPTMAEAGLPAYDFGGWLALIAPAGTPRPVVERLNGALKAVMAQKEVQDELVKLDITTSDNSIDYAVKFFPRELDKHARLVKQSGATLQ